MSLDSIKFFKNKPRAERPEFDTKSEMAARLKVEMIQNLENLLEAAKHDHLEGVFFSVTLNESAGKEFGGCGFAGTIVRAGEDLKHLLVHADQQVATLSAEAGLPPVRAILSMLREVLEDDQDDLGVKH